MPTKTALLLIDVQVGLTSGATPVYGAAGVLARIAGLIAPARAAGVPVVYVQDNDVGGVGSAEWQIDPAVAPGPGELTIQKAWADSFYETQLHDALTARGVQRLVIAGMKSDVCVFMTSTRAVALGYDVALAADAHSTTDDRTLTAPQATAYINDLLDGFGAQDGFGNGQHSITVVPAAEVAFAGR
ncbi:MAG: isochorismatase family protein [Kouleothrix sp.]